MRLGAFIAAAALAAAAATATADSLQLQSEIAATVAGLQTHVLESEVPTSADDQYAVMFDAGSSGSRMYIFRWPAVRGREIPLPETAPFEMYSFTDNSGKGVQLKEGRAIVSALLDSVKTKHLPGKDYSKIPVFLFATAGLRIIDDAARATAVDDLRSIFARSGFMFSDPSWARMISGEEEASFDFLATQLTLNKGRMPRDPSHLIGALDMGGASTQIAFKPAVDPVAGSYALVHGATGITHSVYLHSYLFAGANEWRERVNNVVALSAAQKLATQHPALAEVPVVDILKTHKVPHPCYFAGYEATVAVDALGDKPVTFLGTGEPDVCRQLTRQLLNLDAPCLTDPKPAPATVGSPHIKKHLTPYGFVPETPMSTKPNRLVRTETCAAGGVYQPAVPRNAKFLAFSAFIYNYDYVGAAHNASLSTYRAAVDRACKTSWTAFKAGQPGQPEKFYRDTCLNGVYFSTLLIEAYGIPEDIPGIVQVADAKAGVSWTTGAISYMTNMLGLMQTPPPASPKATAAVATAAKAVDATVKQALRTSKSAPAPAADAIAALGVHEAEDIAKHAAKLLGTNA